MKSVKAKKEKDISAQNNEFIIPNHWIQAAKIAKQVLRKFKNDVRLDDFLSWNQYKRFEYIILKKVPIRVVVRHTKHWFAQSITYPKQPGYIKINLDDHTLENDEKKITEESLFKILRGTLVHELIHFFQDNLDLEQQLTLRERKKLILSGNSFNTNRNSFLYATNWIEMDAELGSYFIQHQFKVPTLKQLIQYFHEWYSDDQLATAIGTYVYDYFLGGRKKLSIREQLFKRKIDFQDFLTV